MRVVKRFCADVVGSVSANGANPAVYSMSDNLLARSHITSSVQR